MLGLGLGLSLGARGQSVRTLISKSVLWLDASDTSTITEAIGRVSQWDDKSGNDNHATQSMGSQQPLLTTYDGKNHILDDGSSTTLWLSKHLFMAGGFTAFFVGRVDTSNYENVAVFSAINNTGYKAFERQPYIYRSSSNLLRLTAGANSSMPFSVPDDTTNVFGVRYNGATSMDAFFNGTTSTQTITPLTDDPAIKGQIFYWYGQGAAIGEVLIFQSDLTTVEMNIIGNYLANKWGISWTTIS